VPARVSPEEGGAVKGSRLLAAIGLLAAVAPAPAARADTIHLTNGNAIQVDAWRDTGDAVEFARGGGIIRILKTDISRIEGTGQSRDLRMYSAPASATVVPTTNSPSAAAREMSQLLKEGEALFIQTVLDAEAKAAAFRRLTAKWRALEVPSALLDLHGRATRALEVSTEAFTAEAEGNTPDSKERIEAARKTFAEVLAAVEQASKES
jgi:hypothetical protein